MQLLLKVCYLQIVTTETKQLLILTTWENGMATEHAAPTTIQKLTADSDYKGSWHWVSRTRFVSIRQTTGYSTIFSMQYYIVVRGRIILHPPMSAQAWFMHFSFYCGTTESEVSQLPDRSVSSNNKRVPSPYWRALGVQTSCRGHWSPWCKGRAAKSQMRFSARNKKETWEKEGRKKERERERWRTGIKISTETGGGNW